MKPILDVCLLNAIDSRTIVVRGEVVRYFNMDEGCVLKVIEASIDHDTYTFEVDSLGDVQPAKGGEPEPTGPILYKTQEELDEALVKWQKILRLQDWKITAKFVRFHDLSDNHGAEIDIRPSRKIAMVKLREANHWDESSPIIEDHEHELVHELMHLLTLDTMDAEAGTDHATTSEEILINMVTSALLTLKRGEVG